MSLRPRPEIEDIELCVHGGPDFAELNRLGLKPEDILDFSVSSNPFGPPPAIREAMTCEGIDRYPDSESADLRASLAEKLGVNPDNIIAGSGSMELIRLVASAYFSPGDRVLVLEPTFGEYELASRIAGAKVMRYRAPAEDAFQVRVEEVCDLIRKHCPKGVFLCNPNNPTGTLLGQAEIERITSACEDTLLVLDEAYIAFAEISLPSLSLINRQNVVILRSMTKDYALAGLRLGYAVANPAIIRNLRKVCPPWNVNVVAQQAGIMALSDPAYLSRCREDILRARDFLQTELAALGLPALPSEAHFFLLKVGDARRFRQALMQRGILVRDCTSFGLPEYVRISPRTLPECRKLIDAVRQIATDFSATTPPSSAMNRNKQRSHTV